MTHLPQMQQSYQPPLIANENAFLGDVATSQSRDPGSPSRLYPPTPISSPETLTIFVVVLEGVERESVVRGKCW